MKNIWKSIVSKPVKHSKNVDTLLFLLSFTKRQSEKNIERTLLVSEAQKGWESTGSGTSLPQYLPDPENKFPVKLLFT